MFLFCSLSIKQRPKQGKERLYHSYDMNLISYLFKNFDLNIWILKAFSKVTFVEGELFLKSWLNRKM